MRGRMLLMDYRQTRRHHLMNVRTQQQLEKEIPVIILPLSTAEALHVNL